MTFLTRFAPSPTGYLHVGNIRTALFNFLLSKKNKGKFLLRIDDTDLERSKQIYEDEIKRDLEWLGIEWDFCERQSSRFARYYEALENLKSENKIYPCYETKSELDLKRKKQLNMGKPPIYDRTALKLSLEDHKKLKEKGKKAHWRFLLDKKKICWNDIIIGSVSIDLESLSDPVFVKEDGQFLYTLASVCDDIDFCITHVVRGSDHLTNTATQIQLMQDLGFDIPIYGHHSLLIDSSGDNLSKRLGSLSIREIRNSGIEPIALINLMSAIGSSKSPKLLHSLDEIFDFFDISLFGSAPTKFDLKLLNSMSAKFLRSTPYHLIESELTNIGIPNSSQKDFWEAIKENLNSRSEISKLWDLCTNGIYPVIDKEDLEFVRIALTALPETPFNKDTWKIWTTKVSDKTGRKGKNLFLPLRKALTGNSVGPDMGKLLPFLGKIPKI